MLPRSSLVFLPFVLASCHAQHTPQLQQVHRTSYNEALAFKLLHLAAAAYGTRYGECVSAAFPPQEGYFVFSSTKSSCDIIDSSCESFIAISNVTRQAVIVFRGTKGKTQLLLEGWESVGKGKQFFTMGMVNSYFRNAHTVMWPNVEEFLKKPEFQGYSLIVTGHSLGGALASLAAARIVMEKYRSANNVKLYTFGQPRTGSYNYAMAFDALLIESYRVVYGADIVPHQPTCEKDKRIPKNEDGSRACLAEPTNQAYHHGTEIWYPQAMVPGSLYMECLGSPKNEDMACSDMLSFQAENHDAYIWDHRHYFNRYVTGFGKSGCTNTTVGQTPPKKSALAGILSKVSGFWDKIKNKVKSL